MGSIQPTEHRPTLVHFEDRHSYPAEVCWGCSDPESGQWVPVTQCTTAKSRMNDTSGSTYADVVVLNRREEP